jgi:transglutaminase-like putative cysteine protease
MSMLRRRAYLQRCVAMMAMPLAMPARLLAEAQAPGEPAARPRHLRYAIIAQNQSAGALERASVLVHAPVQQTSTQRVEALRATRPTVVESDAFGNQMLRVDLDAMAPYSTAVVSIDADLLVFDDPKAETLSPLVRQSFTSPEHNIESTHPRVQALAASLRTDDPVRTARNAFDWMRRHLRAYEYRTQVRGALATFEQGGGSCVDYACLHAALMRASAIPARAVGGYIAAESAVLRAYDYHYWAEFMANGAWRLADAHQGRFTREPGRYVAMRIITSAAPSRLGENGRFRTLEPNLLITMN